MDEQISPSANQSVSSQSIQTEQTSSPFVPAAEKFNFKPIVRILIILAILVVVGLTYRFFIAPANSNWQEYKNTQYALNLQYPAGLRIFENPQQPDLYNYSVSFENPSIGAKILVFNISIFKDANQLTQALQSPDLISGGEMTIGGYQAQKLFALKGSAADFSDVSVYSIPAKNTALIFYSPDFSGVSQADQDKILSSFRFSQ